MLDVTLSVAAQRLRGLRVLIVEDRWHIAKTLEALLEQVGMVIVGAAASASDAERLAHEFAPKVAIVDIKLRDGMEYGLIDHLHDLGIRMIVVHRVRHSFYAAWKSCRDSAEAFRGRGAFGRSRTRVLLM